MTRVSQDLKGFHYIYCYYLFIYLFILLLIFSLVIFLPCIVDVKCRYTREGEKCLLYAVYKCVCENVLYNRYM